MDKNEIIFSGTVKWNKLQMVKNLPFGSLRLQIALPKFDFDMRGELQQVSNPIVWLSVSINKDKDGLFVKRDRELIELVDGDTTPYAIIRGARITNWTNKDGILQYSVEASPGGVSLSSQPVPVLNRCSFEGKVEEYEPSGKMLIKCQYLSPKDNEWKSRMVPVIHTGDFDAVLTNKKVLLFGSVCNTTPNGDNKLYVVSNEIYPLH